MVGWRHHGLTQIGTLMARPWAFLLPLLYGILWLIFSPQTVEWHAIATLATLAMTLVIQRAEHRDTQAIHAKLDELLRVHHDARNELMDLDQREPEDIERLRARKQA